MRWMSEKKYGSGTKRGLKSDNSFPIVHLIQHILHFLCFSKQFFENSVQYSQFQFNFM